MACDLIKGHSIGCRDGIGGVKTLWFAQFDEATITTSAGEVTDLEMGSAHLHGYHMQRGVGSISESITGSTENGTIFYAPVVNVVLNKLTKEDQNEIKLLGQTKVVIFAQLNEQLANGHDVIIGLGVTNGMALNAGTMDSGAAFGDRNGYTLTFDGLEPIPFPMVADYTTNPFDNAAFTNVSIDPS